MSASACRWMRSTASRGARGSTRASACSATAPWPFGGSSSDLGTPVGHPQGLDPVGRVCGQIRCARASSQHRWRPRAGRRRAPPVPGPRCSRRLCPRSGRRTICPTRGAWPKTRRASSSVRSRASTAHAAAITGVTAKPCSAASIAGARQRSSPTLPKRSSRAAQPETAPGTVTEVGPRTAISSSDSGSTPAGARPLAFRPWAAPVVPDDREQVAADAGRHRLADAQDGGGRDRRVDGVAAFLEHAERGTGGERVTRRGHRVGRDGRGASHRYCQVMPSSSPGQFAGSGVFE